MKGLTVSEIQGQLEDEDNIRCDIVLMPDDTEEYSDEDSDNEEDVLPKDPNHLGAGILSQVTEVTIYDRARQVRQIEVEQGPSKGTRGQKRQHNMVEEDKEDEEAMEDEEPKEDEEEEDRGEQFRPGQNDKLNRVHNKDRTWKMTKPLMFGMSVPEFTSPPLKTLPVDCVQPYDFHKLFLDDDFVKHLVDVSQLYCSRKGRFDAQQKFTINNFRVAVAIMHMTGYLTPANRNMYWEQREDTENMFVTKAMAKNTFSEIVRNTYFVESVDPDAGDRFWKVRPLFDQLNKTAKKWVRQPEKVSIDEAIVKYFGPHPLKQFMKGKPHRFGYKV